MKKLFTLFAAVMTAAGMFAGELTIADGTASSAKVPADVFYGDSWQHNQILYPAQYLQDLTGTTLKSFTFHVSHLSDEAMTSTYKVGLAIVTDNYFGSGLWGSYSYNTASLTTVYEGVLDAAQATIKLTFSAPFVYNGGSLLVDIETKATGNYTWEEVQYAGINTDAITCVYGGSMYSIPSSPTGGAAFLPRVTVAYEGDVLAPCLKPTDLEVSAVGSDFAEIAWKAGNEEDQWQVLLLAANEELDWRRATLVSEPKAKFEHLKQASSYVAYVRAYCDANRQGFDASVAIHTECGAIVELPWTENFSSLSSGQWPLECWDRISETNSPAGSFSSSLMFTFNEAGSQIAIGPEFGIRLDTLGISFRYNTNEYAASLEVGFINENDEFEPVDLYFPRTKDWANMENVKLENLPEEVRRLAFRYTFVDEEPGFVYLDNITIDVLPEEEETGVESIQPSVSIQKVLRNGQLIIVRDGKQYNAQGAQL